jgi:hypothetical protein
LLLDKSASGLVTVGIVIPLQWGEHSSFAELTHLAKVLGRRSIISSGLSGGDSSELVVPSDNQSPTHSVGGRLLRTALLFRSATLLIDRNGFRHVIRIQRWYWVLRILEIRYQVVRGSPWETLDAWILHDRLVEIGEHHGKQGRRPAIVFAGILSRRVRRCPFRRCSIEDHVVLLVGIHGEVVDCGD